jgi:hypothetical protein
VEQQSKMNIYLNFSEMGPYQGSNVIQVAIRYWQ